MAVSGWGGTTNYINEALKAKEEEDRRRAEQEQREREAAIRAEQERQAQIRAAQQQEELARRQAQEEAARQEAERLRLEQQAREEAERQERERREQARREEERKRYYEQQALAERLRQQERDRQQAERERQAQVATQQREQDEILQNTIGGRNAPPKLDYSRGTAFGAPKPEREPEVQAGRTFEQEMADLAIEDELSLYRANAASQEQSTQFRYRNMPQQGPPTEESADRWASEQGWKPPVGTGTGMSGPFTEQDYLNKFLPWITKQTEQSNETLDEIIRSLRQAGKDIGNRESDIAKVYADAVRDGKNPRNAINLYMSQQLYEDMSSALPGAQMRDVVRERINQQYGPGVAQGLTSQWDLFPGLIGVLNYVSRSGSMMGLGTNLTIGERAGATLEAVGDTPTDPRVREDNPLQPKNPFSPLDVPLIRNVREMATGVAVPKEKNALGFLEWIADASGNIPVPGVDVTLEETALGLGQLGRIFGANYDTATEQYLAIQNQERRQDMDPDTAMQIGYRSEMYEGDANLAGAKLVARYIAMSGPDAAEAAVDDILTKDQKAQSLLQRALTKAEQARNMLPGKEKDKALYEAALLGASAWQKSQETGYDVYNNHQVWYRELVGEIATDPTTWLDAVTGILGVAGAVGKIKNIPILKWIPSAAMRPYDAILLTGIEEVGNTKPFVRPWTYGLAVAAANVTDKLASPLRTGSGKATLSIYRTFPTLATAASHSQTVGDAKVILQAIVKDPVGAAKNGIDAKLLSGLLQAQAADGRYILGHSGMMRMDFQQEMKVLKQPGFMEAVDSLPSLRGDPNAPLDLNQFSRELIELMGRTTGQYYQISKTGIPYGTDAVRIVDDAANPGRKAVEHVGGDGKVILTIGDMTPFEAQKVKGSADDWLKASARGAREWKANPADWTGSQIRSVLSANALTQIGSGILNFGSVVSYHLMNSRRPAIVTALQDGMDFVRSRTGGMILNQRMALDAVADGADDIMQFSTGLGGFLSGGELLLRSVEAVPGGRIVTALPRAGRKFRMWGEEAAARMVYADTFKKAWQLGTDKLEGQILGNLLSGIDDPNLRRRVKGQLKSAIYNGDRRTVAAEVARIGAGKFRKTIEEDAPMLVDVLTDAELKELNDILGSVTPATRADGQLRLRALWEKATDRHLQDIDDSHIPRRMYWTEDQIEADIRSDIKAADDALKSGAIDKAEYDKQIENLKNTARGQKEISDALLANLQMAQGRPDMSPPIYMAWDGLNKANADYHTAQRLAYQQYLADLDGIDGLIASGTVVPPGTNPDEWLAAMKGEAYRRYDSAVKAAATQRYTSQKGVIAKLGKDISDAATTVTPRSPASQQAVGNIAKSIDMGDLESRYATYDWVAVSRDDPDALDMKLRLKEQIEAKYTNKIMLAVQTVPTQNSVDIMMSAQKWVARNNRLQKIKDDAAYAAWKAGTITWEKYRQARLGWDKVLNENIQMMDAAAAMIFESKALRDWNAKMIWQDPSIPGKYYRLDGRDPKSGMWIVFNAATGKKMQIDPKSKLIPQAAKDAYEAARKNLGRNVAEQMGWLAQEVGIGKFGVKEFDDAITQMAESGTNPAAKILRQTILDRMGSPTSGYVLPANIRDWSTDMLDAVGHSLDSILDSAVDINRGGMRGLGPDWVARANRELLPQMDNLAIYAETAASRAMSRAAVNFTNHYWWDSAINLFGGYGFWASRMALNTAFDLVRQPWIPAASARTTRMVYQENRGNNEPTRNLFQLPGVRLPSGQAGLSYGVDLPGLRWTPTFANIAGTRYPSVYQMKEGLDLLDEADNNWSTGFWKSAASVGQSALGIGAIAGSIMEDTVFGQQWVLPYVYRAAQGNPIDFRVSDMGGITRILGEAAMVAGASAMNNPEQQWMARAGLGIASVLSPANYPFLVGQTATYNAAAGRYDKDPEKAGIVAQWAQDIAYQDKWNVGALPEQPQGMGKIYGDTLLQTAEERLLRATLGFLFPITVTRNYENEEQLEQAAQNLSTLGYDPITNPAGSKAATSEAFAQVPGLGPRFSQYAVTAADPNQPNQPDPDTLRPGLRAVQGTFYPERERLFNEARTEKEQIAADALAGRISESEAFDRIGAINERLFGAESDPDDKGTVGLLDAQFPSMASIERSGTSLRGMNPDEAREHLRITVGRQVAASADHPYEKYSPNVVVGLYKDIEAMPERTKEEYYAKQDAFWYWHRQNDVYKQKKAEYEQGLVDETERLMQEPSTVESILPGAYLEVDGKVVQVPDRKTAPVPPTADILRPLGTGTALGNPELVYGGTAEELVESYGNRNRGPNETEFREKGAAKLAGGSGEKGEASSNFQANTAAALEIYGDYADVVAEYDGMLPSRRSEFVQENPVIRAVNMARYNPEQHAELEGMFGQGVVLKWATQPAWSEDNNDRAEYWRKNPEVFLAHSWINGRPQEYDEDRWDPDFEYDFGKDYATAEEMFGSDIWSIVRQAKAMPAYEQGNAELGRLWGEFYDKYPQYREWRDWWYGNLPEFKSTSSSVRVWSSWGGGGGWGGGWGGGGGRGRLSAPGNPPYSYSRRYETPRIEGYERRFNPQSDWRRYLQDPPSLEKWRR